MTLKQVRLHFVVCPKQGNEIEGTVSQTLFVLKMFYPKQVVEGFKPSADSPLPKYWSSIALPTRG